MVQTEHPAAAEAFSTGMRPGVDASACKDCGALRVDSQLGLEKTPDEYVAAMVGVFREVWRILRDDGTVWLNIGDSFSGANRGDERRDKDASGVVRPKVAKECERCGEKFEGGTGRRFCSAACGGSDNSRRGSRYGNLKAKDLIGIPWMLAFALRADGWYLRSDCVWHKKNPMPESVTDRPTRSHEYVFMLSKKPRYFYDATAIREKPTGSDPRVRRDSRSVVPEGSMRSNDLETLGLTRGKTNQPCSHPDGSNKRTVWSISTKSYKGAHFATFPMKLVEPCVKAGSSLKGCCPKCGAPWRRIVHKDRRASRPGIDTKCLPHSDGCLESAELFGWNRPNVIGNRDPQRHVTVTKTVGWESSCGCLEARHPIPCTIFDPFAGAGTTILVAELLGRNSVGTDLSRPYLEMAKQRVIDKTKCESRIVVPKPRKPLKGQMSMFGD